MEDDHVPTLHKLHCDETEAPTLDDHVPALHALQDEEPDGE